MVENKKYRVSCPKESWSRGLGHCVALDIYAKSPKDAAEKYVHGKVRRVTGNLARNGHADVEVESKRAVYLYDKV